MLILCAIQVNGFGKDELDNFIDYIWGINCPAF
jgi:hypothetical protein